MKRHRGPDGRSSAVGDTDATDPGAAAARARVADVLESFTRLELQVVVVAMPDPEREAARERARSAAIVAGRIGLFDEAADAARRLAIGSFARGGFSGTWAATEMAASVVNGRERVAAAAALEEAAVAAVVEDLVDGETLEVLRATADEFVRVKGMPRPGSLGSIGTPVNQVTGLVGAVFAVIAVAAIIAGVVVVGSVAGAILALFGVAAVAGSATAPATVRPVTVSRG